MRATDSQPRILSAANMSLQVNLDMFSEWAALLFPFKHRLKLIAP